ncbi:MAG: hypothetical protein Q7S74_01125 [Nanoarchaeota archaeon]|nr:hypothetical protein [Nanoarchaeota archaeon]
MSRIGDQSMEERVNEGQCELRHFFPDEGDRTDAYTAITSSPMRQWIYHDLRKPARAMHQSTRRDSAYIQSVELDDHVISSPIEVDGISWVYSTEKDPVSIRRCFIKRNQAIELDIEESLRWMSAGIPGSIRYEDVRRLLEEEANPDNVPNEIIRQKMYARIESGKSMISYMSHKRPLGHKRKED